MDASYYKPDIEHQLHDARVHLHMLRTNPEAIFNFDTTDMLNELGLRLLQEISSLEEDLKPTNNLVVRALGRSATI